MEIFITGSSRPSVYPIFWESFKEMVKMDCASKVTAYEDVILPKESAKVKKYIKPKVDVYIEINPFKRLGYVYNEILKNVSTKYFLYLQEDWKFLKPIDVDKLIEIMDDNPFIEQIWFPKFMQKNHWKSLTGEILTFKDIKLTEWKGDGKKNSSSSWAFLPHIVRTNFIRGIYEKANCHNQSRPESLLKKWISNQQQLSGKELYDKISWIFDNEKEYIQHLGIKKLSSKNLIMMR
jgi:hypothetical protein